MKIGFLGGGNFGNNLAELLAKAGQDVVVGLRNPARARPGASYKIASLEDAAKFGDIVIIAIPYLACAETLPSFAKVLAGKIVIDSTNPLKEDWSPLYPDQIHCAGEEIARIFPASRIVKAFNTIFADIMTQDRISRAGQPATAFIAGNDIDANSKAAMVATFAGFSPLITGPLSNARYLEAMANLHIQIAVVHGGGTNAAFLYHQIKGEKTSGGRHEKT